jgi:hypothetical protein
MRGTWTSDYLREQFAGGYTEVPRDLTAKVLTTIYTEDHKVFVIYDDKKFAVVESVKPERGNR